MTIEQKAQAESLREEGLGYKRIAYIIGVPFETVKSHLRRHPSDSLPRKTTDVKIWLPHTVPATVEEYVYLPCLQCGESVRQNPGRKQKKFCCAQCRNNWWNQHKYRLDRPSARLFQCAGCGCQFRAYGTTKRKYCSHQCYIMDRFYAAPSE